MPDRDRVERRRIGYSIVKPGDRLLFERTGGVVYGGAVWQSPTTGDVLAGDTFLTSGGEWLPAAVESNVTVILDTSYRRHGEDWNPRPAGL